jgi:cyclopropane-fatty-acyl-phospholipid synthase
VTSTKHDTGWVIDPARWPDVAAARGPAPRREAARLLFRAAVARLPIRVRLPDGRDLGLGSPGAPVMVIRDPSAFFTRLGAWRAGRTGIPSSKRACPGSPPEDVPVSHRV